MSKEDFPPPFVYVPMEAQGGDDIFEIVEVGRTYRVHIFKQNGNFEILSEGTEQDVEYLIVGGGGDGSSIVSGTVDAGHGGSGVVILRYPISP